MKAPQFDYVRVSTLNEVFSLLREYGDDARIIAGGQTLLATLNMRLSEPQILIDISGLKQLKQVTVSGGVLSLGATVTHAQIEDSPVIRQHLPLLSDVAPFIAHRAIRNLGTFGGSIAFADPAAEWPSVLIAARGTVIVQGANGQRRILADEFFIELYTTALEPGEVIIGFEFPVVGPKSVHVFDELTRRHGDYAIVGAAVTGTRADDGRLLDARVVFLGTGNTPERARTIEALLAETVLTPESAATIARALKMTPNADIYNSPETKLHLAKVTLERLLVKLTQKQEAIRHG